MELSRREEFAMRLLAGVVANGPIWKNRQEYRHELEDDKMISWVLCLTDKLIARLDKCNVPKCRCMMGD